MKILTEFFKRRRIKKLIELVLEEKEALGIYDPSSDSPENNRVLIMTIADILTIEKLKELVEEGHPAFDEE